MNKAERKSLIEAQNNLSKMVDFLNSVNCDTDFRPADVLEEIDNAVEVICEVRDDNEWKFDSLTEGLQSTEMGQRMCDVISALEDAESYATEYMDMQRDYDEPFDVEEAVGVIENIMGSIDEAVYA